MPDIATYKHSTSVPVYNGTTADATAIGNIVSGTYFSGEEISTDAGLFVHITSIKVNDNGTYKNFVGNYALIRAKDADKTSAEAVGTGNMYVFYQNGTYGNGNSNNSSCWTYREPSFAVGSRFDKLAKNIKFTASVCITDPDWLIITDCSNARFKGKYIRAKYATLNEGADDVWYLGQEDTVSTTTEDTVTIDPTTGEATVTVSAPEAAEPMEMGDEFYYTYQSETITESQYMNDLNLESSLSIQDIRGIFGAPHQWLPIADPRLSPDADTSVGKSKGLANLGRMYSTKIIKTIPVLFITPGVPNFMSSFSKSQKTKFLDSLASISFGSDGDKYDLNTVLDNNTGKYYTLKFAYAEYYEYVNAMCRSAAVFLGIQNDDINGHKLWNFQWLYNQGFLTDTNYSETDSDNFMTNLIQGLSGFVGTDIFGSSGLRKAFGPYAGAIPFYADCGNTVSDSFTNSTTESQLAGTMNSLSDQARELNFLVGNVGANLGKIGSLTNSLLGTGEEGGLGNMLDTITGWVDQYIGTGNVISNLLHKGQVILGGGRLIFPEIWADSQFSRSYSCNMKLVSPAGDKLSIYLNILVPIYFLLALAMPRQVYGQTYYSPFLVRAYSKGLFNVDMGIITDLSITKGAEGEWTKDGIPTVAEVSFSIKDMYDGIGMSKTADIFTNVTELDYIANSCGINVNDHEVGRTATLYLILKGTSEFQDKLQIGVFGQLSQKVNQTINSIFGVFD